MACFTDYKSKFQNAHMYVRINVSFVAVTLVYEDVKSYWHS